MIKASSPFGSYTLKNLVLNTPHPVSGSGAPHQGSLVDTPNGQWYYMAFLDAYPGGRIPVLAPITWGSDGFPAVTVRDQVHRVYSLTQSCLARQRSVGDIILGSIERTSCCLSHWRRLLHWLIPWTQVGMEP